MTDDDVDHMADKPALVTHCSKCDEELTLARHIKSMNIGGKRRYYAVCYDCT